MPRNPQPSDAQLSGLARLLVWLADNNHYPDRDGLIDAGIDDDTVDELLRQTPHSGDGGRPVIPANELQDRLGLIDLETPLPPE